MRTTACGPVSEAQAGRPVAVVALLVGFDIGRRQMAVDQLLRRQTCFHLNIDAITTGNAEQPLCRVHGCGQAMLQGILQHEPGHPVAGGAGQAVDSIAGTRGLQSLAQSSILKMGEWSCIRGPVRQGLYPWRRYRFHQYSRVGEYGWLRTRPMGWAPVVQERSAGNGAPPASG